MTHLLVPMVSWPLFWPTCANHVSGEFPALSDGEQSVAGYQAILDSIAAFKTPEEANFGNREEADLIS